MRHRGTGGQVFDKETFSDVNIRLYYGLIVRCTDIGGVTNSYYRVGFLLKVHVVYHTRQ